MPRSYYCLLMLGIVVCLATIGRSTALAQSGLADEWFYYSNETENDVDVGLSEEPNENTVQDTDAPDALEVFERKEALKEEQQAWLLESIDEMQSRMTYLEEQLLYMTGLMQRQESIITQYAEEARQARQERDDILAETARLEEESAYGPVDDVGQVPVEVNEEPMAPSAVYED